MTKIGEAAYDERGALAYGQPGDQTGLEVRILDMYDDATRPWVLVFRAKKQEVRDKLALAMTQACNNNNIGYAQYDNDEIAMKVWRHVNGHWSRQSEELPIHRNLDLTILLLHVLFDEAPNPDSFLVKAQTLFSEDQKGGIEEIKKYYQKNKSFLEPRLKELRELLNKMK